MRVYRIKRYVRQAAKLMSEEEIRIAEASVVAAPDFWPVIPETGGARKARIPLEGRGKRGGGRIIYFWHSTAGATYFLMAYAKNKQEDIGYDDKKELREIIASIKG
jgi:hypothetical protein